MQKITPFLWFDSNAEEAAKFYVSIFKDSKIKGITRYGEAGKEFHGKEPGTAMTVAFQLQGQGFTAINGGPHFKLTEAISFVVNCESQKELDYFWEKLSADGQGQCGGWLKDKYGLSWQIVPTALAELLNDKHPKKSQRVMQALLQMTKIDIQRLQAAAATDGSTTTT